MKARILHKAKQSVKIEWVKGKEVKGLLEDEKLNAFWSSAKQYINVGFKLIKFNYRVEQEIKTFEIKISDLVWSLYEKDKHILNFDKVHFTERQFFPQLERVIVQYLFNI